MEINENNAVIRTEQVHAHTTLIKHLKQTTHISLIRAKQYCKQVFFLFNFCYMVKKIGQTLYNKQVNRCSALRDPCSQVAARVCIYLLDVNELNE